MGTAGTGRWFFFKTVPYPFHIRAHRGYTGTDMGYSGTDRRVRVRDFFLLFLFYKYILNKE
jgi:hypothetical protein